MNIALKTCLVAAGLVLAHWASAQAPALTSTLAAKRVETVSGKTVLSPGDAGKPGDLVEYTGTYHNGGNRSVDKLVATVPVPVGTTFVEGSAEPAHAQASVDGVRFEAMPLMRTVRQADGKVRQEPVPLSEYRYVRWDIGTLAPASDALVKLRVRIDTSATTAGR